MEDQLISFETAKLAKLKGFDSSFRYYNFEGKIEPIIGLVSNYCPAPTQSLLQRWLRDKKLIDISVDGYWAKHGIKLYTSKICMSMFTEVRTLSFNSYELALEDALLNALKLIK